MAEKAVEAKKLREEFNVLNARLRDAKDKYIQLRNDFMGHYQWLAGAVHNQYHDRSKHFGECDDTICSSVRQTLEDLKQIELDLRE